MAVRGGGHRVRRAPQPHLERLVTGSRITMHSFTSPYLQKYSFRPSEAEEQQVQTPPQHPSPQQQRLKKLSKQPGIFTSDREPKRAIKSSRFHLTRGLFVTPGDLPCVVCQLSPPMNILLQGESRENKTVTLRNSDPSRAEE